MAVIEFRAVTKTYRGLLGARTTAMAGVDLEVPAGGVFGLVGPNGCGKTTTIRTLLGLARPDSGDVRLLDVPVPKGLGAIRHRVGALVETPKFFPRYSGRLNLELLAGLKGVGNDQVQVVIERVGLVERADSAFSSYSLGMRQRLAVAGAMLGDPDVLVLDEPANGLDPAGIAAMRDLLVAFGQSGRTVLVSSHHLADVERICDRVAVMSAGRVMASGSMAELTGGAARVSVTVRDVAGDMEVLAAAGISAERGPSLGQLVVDAVPGGEAINRVLSEGGIHASEIAPLPSRLEDTFLRLTGTDPLATGMQPVQRNPDGVGP